MQKAILAVAALSFLRAARNLLSQIYKPRGRQGTSCTLESSKFCSPDWANLAPDILHQIFSIRQPLQLELRLVCRAWASAFTPLLTRIKRLTAHSSGVWEHSRLGSSSPADVQWLTKFCNLRQLDLQSLNGSLSALPPLPQLRELSLGRAQLCPPDLDHLRILSSLNTLRLEFTDTTQLDITPLQDLHSLRCLAVSLHVEVLEPDKVYDQLVNINLDNVLVRIGERGGLTQLTGFTVLVAISSWEMAARAGNDDYKLVIQWHSSKRARYVWMRNLRSLELAAVGPLYSKHPHQRLPIDFIEPDELERLCEEAPKLRSLTLTTRICPVYLADVVASLTGLTAVNLTMYDGCHQFPRLPLDLVTSLQFWANTLSCDCSYPFHLCDNLISLTCFKPMKGAQIGDLLQLTQLRSLELQRGFKHSCTPAEISNLGRLTGLTKLQLGFKECEYPLNCIHAVGELSRLRQLSLDLPWGIYQIMALCDHDCMSSLRGLDAHMGVRIAHNLGPMSLEPLQGLTNLTRLEVLHWSRKYWAASALLELTTLTSLRRLVIHRLADADVPLLASLTQLTYLRMVGESKVSDWFRTEHKRRTGTLSKLPQLLSFSTVSYD